VLKLGNILKFESIDLSNSRNVCVQSAYNVSDFDVLRHTASLLGINAGRTYNYRQVIANSLEVVELSGSEN